MWIIIVTSFLFLTNHGCFSLLISEEPEIKMVVPEIIKYYGYPCEIHQATTEDGYILTMHRIPNGREGPTDDRPVVFLQHGLADSSFAWVANGPQKSLAFVLADQGFDVWLGNTRGNRYSNSNTNFLNNTNKFWDFTWDDMVKYDLDAMINYVLSQTNVPKLGYVGHSQGTEIAFAKFSQQSDINSKVYAFVALAPVVYLGHLKTAIKYLSHFGSGINAIVNLFGTGEFLPNNVIIDKMGQFLCGSTVGNLLCGNVLFLFYGPGSANMNYTRVPIYIAHVPAGTSSKNVDHYGQSHLSNKFQLYDYGYAKNMLRYRQLNPPLYRLNTDGLPIAMIWGGNDWLSVPEDVQRAIGELGDNVKLKKFIPEYNHVDIIWGNTAHELVFPDVITFLNSYKP